ncbi:MAG: hypothetical protein LAO05_02080 [Acidobacteriia bacterium]|nr:hypothetical protein [Terriglobia bacterium]
MHDRSTKKPGRADLNEIADRIVQHTTEPPEDDGKNPNAVALGRLGGLKGGPARAAKLTAKQRSNIAKKASAVRWAPKK